MTVEKKVVKALKEKNLVLATAESCTGGLVSKTITDVSGSSSVFNCAVVSYSNEIKESILGVSHETLEKYGAVSEQTVREMVIGVLKLSKADIAVSVSGIAGPASDNTLKPVGLIYIAVSDGVRTVVKELNNSFSDNVRENNRLTACNEALNLIMEFIGG